MNNYLKLKWYDIILLIILFFLGALLLNPLISFLAKKLNITPYVFTPIITIGSYLLVYITYYFIVLKPRKENFRISYSLKNIRLFPIALLLFFGQYLVSEFLTGLIPTQGGILEKMYKTMSYALLGNASHYPVITFISVCIVAPIFEELFFRGFILKGMLNNQIKPQKAILISALIFGGIHIFPWQVIGGILAGIVLGITFYKTGSLLTCTILHCMNNSIGFLFFIRYKSLESPDLGFSDCTLFMVGIIIIAIFGSIYMKLTKNQSWKSY
ncbi:hypothetical protein Ga0061079_10775 [Apibacter mensalis]|uniref:CAAX prenyl protease 2/Lysostaphin resistance protein A-like domain-containing protein n=1 Tax=Apibacter mensalis TaxID=1586267 RepID=A0A0X3AQE5_9FLAO|nr:type II CAAX endopeptidase family protein [Apibacter mensalis]CVK16473.1 hypothetical protein Ga0061079_10775 [Apibacter mensalis]